MLHDNLCLASFHPREHKLDSQWRKVIDLAHYIVRTIVGYSLEKQLKYDMQFENFSVLLLFSSERSKLKHIECKRALSSALYMEYDDGIKKSKDKAKIYNHDGQDKNHEKPSAFSTRKMTITAGQVHPLEVLQSERIFQSGPTPRNYDLRDMRNACTLNPASCLCLQAHAHQPQTTSVPLQHSEMQ